jgi:asparagine synthase (glutamine-hydrolysing)
MCGIAVAIDWENAEQAVRSMLGGILHRGDVTDPVISSNSRTAMGTRRLRIVDADHAVQPQPSADGRILVSFNGEIYNHNEIRRELEALGLSFRTHSDTEVIASALQAWGIAALQRFIGMFAFVAVEVATGAFMAVRDPMGVKPLYFIESESGAGFLFCSEIRPLLDASPTGQVMLVPPGFVIAPGICQAYASRLNVIRMPPPEGDAGLLDGLLDEAVRIRLPPDLPVAGMFSGGIDSTLMMHYARKYDDRIPGYFLGGPGAPDYEFAARYADMTGLDLRLVPFATDHDTFPSMEEVVGSTEAFEPEVIRSALCSYVMSRRIHEDGFRVALCGEGADELFCGYLPLELVFAEGSALGNPVRGQCLSHMNRTNLQRVDRCSMQFQLEARVPFLDPSIIVYALGLDASALVKEFDGVPRGKMPLRELYDLYPSQLPVEIRDRTKIPFNVGAGIDKGDCDSPWFHQAQDSLSDADLEDGKKRYEGFSIKNKEELMYLDILARTMDVSRVNHLKVRTYLIYPDIKRMSEIQSSIVGTLQ